MSDDNRPAGFSIQTDEFSEKPDQAPTSLVDQAPAAAHVGTATILAPEPNPPEEIALDFEGEDDDSPRQAIEKQANDTLAPLPEADRDLPFSDPNMEEDDEDDEGPKRFQRLLQESTFRPIQKGKEAGIPLALPTLPLEDVATLLSVTQQVMNQLTEEQRNAVLVHGASIPLIGAPVWQQWADDPARKLVQVLRSSDGTPLVSSSPSFKPPVKGAILDLAESSAYAARLSKAYDFIYLIAPHSGMWLKTQVPSGRERHNLLGQMTAKRAQLGYSTKGSTLSSDSALRNMELVNFIIEHTLSTNMVDSSPESIRRNLVALDIQLLAQQLASACYPSGHVVERACSTKPGLCSHVEVQTLRLSKIQHLDENCITDKQRTHMQTLLRKSHRKTDQDMAAYRAEFGANVTRRVLIADDVFVTFEFPSIEVYENTAEEWASSIRRESEQVLELMTEDEARRHLEQQASLSVMSKYAAWVTEIELDGRFVQDRNAIRNVLAQLSEQDEVVKRFTDAVGNYIRDCTVGVVGVEDYKCPVCNGAQATGEKGITASIAVIDAVTTFFTLAQLRIRQSLLTDTAF